MAIDWDVNVRLAQIPGLLAAAGTVGLVLATEHVLGVSNAHSPIEEGTLERSGTAAVDGLTGTIAYDTPYAVKQHEDLTLRHDEGRTAKYLENALNSEAALVGTLLQTQLRRALRS